MRGVTSVLSLLPTHRRLVLRSVSLFSDDSDTGDLGAVTGREKIELSIERAVQDCSVRVCIVARVSKT